MGPDCHPSLFVPSLALIENTSRAAIAATRAGKRACNDWYLLESSAQKAESLDNWGSILPPKTPKVYLKWGGEENRRSSVGKVSTFMIEM